MRTYTDDKYKSIPHVVITSETPWDPSTKDFKVDEQWFVNTPKANITSPTDVYDEFGDRRFQANIASRSLLELQPFVKATHRKLLWA